MIDVTLEDLERAPWMLHATQMYVLGVKEIPGAPANKWIQLFNGFCRDLSKAAKATDEVAWCAAFAAYCLEMAQCESTHSARARSYEKWGLELEQPRWGSVMVFSAPERGPAAGHVAFYTRHLSATLVECLGGNQGNSVSLAPFAVSQIVSIRTPNKFP